MLRGRMGLLAPTVRTCPSYVTTRAVCTLCCTRAATTSPTLQDMRKAMAHVKATMRWTPPKSDKKYQTIVHTPRSKCPAYLTATLALRGIDPTRSGPTETDEEWAALEQLLAGRVPRPAVMEYMAHPLTQREYAKRVTQALVQAQYVAATMIDARHGARHKHLHESTNSGWRRR